MEPDADLHASAEYRRRLAGVLAKRVLTAARDGTVGELLANRFGRYYSDGAGKEVSSRIIAAGSRGQQRVSTR